MIKSATPILNSKDESSNSGLEVLEAMVRLATVYTLLPRSNNVRNDLSD